MNKTIIVAINFLLIFQLFATNEQNLVNIATFNFSNESVEFKIELENSRLWHSGNIGRSEYSVSKVNIDNFDKVLFRTDNSDWLVLGEYTEKFTGGKNYCLYVDRNGMPSVTMIDEFIGIASSDDLLFLVNETGRSLSQLKLAEGYESKEVGLKLQDEEIETAFSRAYPVSNGSWKIFWEYSDDSDYYLSLPSEVDGKPLVTEFTGGDIYIFVLFTDELGMSSYTKLIRL